VRYHLIVDTIRIALKEWHVVCRALREGRQTILLRKGGILEAKSGFQIQHARFALFPTFLHQDVEMLKPEARRGFVAHASEPGTISIETVADVADIVQLHSREQMNALDDEHIWTVPLIDMRFNYKPNNPLYLLILRAYRFAQPVTIENTSEYAGCKSWVPLETVVNCEGAAPVIDNASFEARRRRILERLR
jgi:hypothetical protein